MSNRGHPRGWSEQHRIHPPPPGNLRQPAQLCGRTGNRRRTTRRTSPPARTHTQPCAVLADHAPFSATSPSTKPGVRPATKPTPSTGSKTVKYPSPELDLIPSAGGSVQIPSGRITVSTSQTTRSSDIDRMPDLVFDQTPDPMLGLQRLSLMDEAGHEPHTVGKTKPTKRGVEGGFDAWVVATRERTACG